MKRSVTEIEKAELEATKPDPTMHDIARRLCAEHDRLAEELDRAYLDVQLHCHDSINAARPGCSWDANPWVWVVTFGPAEVRS